jgi:hypothetical protein
MIKKYYIRGAEEQYMEMRKIKREYLEKKRFHEE